MDELSLIGGKLVRSPHVFEEVYANVETVNKPSVKDNNHAVDRYDHQVSVLDRSCYRRSAP